MVSELAIEEAEKLAAKGTPLTPREIVRLNALGLELQKGKDTVSFALPRLAFLGDVVFREPTLGHDIWLDDVRRFADMDDVRTSLAVHAFALSHMDPDDLPALGKVRLRYDMMDFKRKMRKYTPRQISAALRWVTEGNDVRRGELPPPRNDDELVDESHSVAIGTLLDGIAVVTGLSVGDARHLTSAELFRLERRAMALRECNVDDVRKNIAQGDFYATLDELTARAKNRAGRQDNIASTKAAKTTMATSASSQTTHADESTSDEESPSDGSGLSRLRRPQTISNGVTAEGV